MLVERAICKANERRHTFTNPCLERFDLVESSDSASKDRDDEIVREQKPSVSQLRNANHSHPLVHLSIMQCVSHWTSCGNPRGLKRRVVEGRLIARAEQSASLLFEHLETDVEVRASLSGK